MFRLPRERALYGAALALSLLLCLSLPLAASPLFSPSSSVAARRLLQTTALPLKEGPTVPIQEKPKQGKSSLWSVSALLSASTSAPSPYPYSPLCPLKPPFSHSPLNL
jgi:hypothetical protein